MSKRKTSHHLDVPAASDPADMALHFDESENTVMLAMDSSHHASEVLDYYLDRIHRKENKVILLYVMELPTSADDAIHAMMSQDVIKELWTKENDKAVHIETKFIDALQNEGVEHVSIVNRSGAKPGKVVCKVAEQQHANLIVVGSKGHGGLTGKFLGSTSDYIVNHAVCPVLVCRKGHAPSRKSSVASLASDASGRDRHRSGHV